MVVAAVLSFTGCYNDFDDPAPAKVWTEADFNKDQIITIKQLKDIYYAKYAPGSTAGRQMCIRDRYQATRPGTFINLFISMTRLPNPASN